MKKLIKLLIATIFLLISFVFIIDIDVIFTSKQYIKNDYSELKNVDCILILGAGIWDDEPSPMLKDRLDKGIELYKNNVSGKLLMSGDHVSEGHDEVNVMKKYAINNNINSSDVFMDHAGISTYDSIYRLKEIFGVKKVVIVTQKYHLYRAIFIARSLGIEAYGVSAEDIHYNGQALREVREILARDKDFVKSLLKVKSKYSGETVLVSGDGNVTNDEYTYER